MTDAPEGQTQHAQMREECELSDDQCDRLVALTMDKLAAKHGIHALDLNASITEHHALRRSIVKVAHQACAKLKDAEITRHREEMFALRKHALEIEAMLSPAGIICLDGNERLGHILASVKSGVERLQSELAERRAEAEQMKQQIAMDTECVERIRTKASRLEVLNESLSAKLARYEQMEPTAYDCAVIENGVGRTALLYDCSGSNVIAAEPLFTHPKE